MNKSFSVSVVLLVMLMMAFTEGSLKLISSGPYTAMLTPELTLACHLDDDMESILGNFVGGGAAALDVSKLRTTSIMIMRGNRETVASVNEMTGVQAFADEMNIDVTGRIPRTTGGEGYLKIKWSYPTADQRGHYRCEISALTTEGRAVAYNKSLSIDMGPPTVQDLVLHIRNLTLEGVKKSTEISLLMNDTKKLKDETKALKNETAEHGKNLNIMQHIESGNLNCPMPKGQSHSSWSGREGDYQYIDTTHSFDHPYPVAPVVHLGVDNFRIYNYHASNQAYIDFVVELKSVTQVGFTMRCKGYYQSGGYNNIYKLSANWISVPRSGVN